MSVISKVFNRVINTDIDSYRRGHLAVAEFIDAWRIIPRFVIGVYILMLAHTFLWYKSLKPYTMEGCDLQKLGEMCIVQAPTTQQTALLTALVGLAVGVFGLYTSSGKKWDNGFIPWKSVSTDLTKE